VSTKLGWFLEESKSGGGGCTDVPTISFNKYKRLIIIQVTGESMYLKNGERKEAYLALKYCSAAFWSLAYL
jgi:hypothetical protein